MDSAVLQHKGVKMADYIQFISADGGSILVEVEEEEVSSQAGVQKAGLREITGKAMATAQVTFQDALERMLQYNAQVMRDYLRKVNPRKHVLCSLGYSAWQQAATTRPLTSAIQP